MMRLGSSSVGVDNSTLDYPPVFSATSVVVQACHPSDQAVEGGGTKEIHNQNIANPT